MDESLKAVIDHLETKQPQMVDQLFQFCEINSGSTNLDGLKTIRELLSLSYEPFADEIIVKPAQDIININMQGQKVKQSYGDALFIRKRPHLKKRILLSGHMDTVFAEDHPFQKLNHINDREINGPGVSDMKGGLIVMLHTLAAFENTEASKKLGWDVLINADEELGSPSSSSLISEIAGQYQAALVYEPAMTAQGTIAKNRKGSGKLTIVVTGKAAHAGRKFNEGRNAICHLAKFITKIDQLNGLRDGVTINVGLIQGGEALNIVPETAVAKLDIRISKPDDEEWVRNELHNIQEQVKHPDYSITIDGKFARPVKKVNKGTERLFKRLQYFGSKLGINIDWQDSGGCCDGNNIAAHGVPVLDTLGVRGGNIHSSDEFIVTESLSERAKLSTLLLHDLAQGGLEDLQL